MDRFFVPKKEDLRLGFEYEVYLKYHNKWENRIITELSNDRDGSGGFADIEFLIDSYPEHIRVSFLTKEQIEAEGWKSLSDISPFTGKPYKWRKKFEDGFNHWRIYTIEFDGISNPRLQIHLSTETSYINENKYIYSGECKDINTFRYICKLLNIN